jgi:hypothetical protein
LELEVGENVRDDLFSGRFFAETAKFLRDGGEKEQSHEEEVD